MTITKTIFLEALGWNEDTAKIIGWYIVGQIFYLSGELVPCTVVTVTGMSYAPFDQLIVYISHVLGLVSFLIAIVVGLPKAWKVIRPYLPKRKNRKRGNRPR